MRYRFRVKGRRFGFKLDVLFSARRKAIFIHGCFWHGHDRGADRTPRTRSEFWQAKIAANQTRDQWALEAFATEGWKFLVIWECEIRDAGDLAVRLELFLGLVRWPART